MSGNDRIQAEMKFQLLLNCDSKNFYNNWAADFEKDFSALDYRGIEEAVDIILTHFTGRREEALVLDVACGPGTFARVMKEQGFSQFEGVDYSERMLMEAEKTGLYQELKLANLGTDPLPGDADRYDVVAMISALPPGHVPLSVFREICQVTKPGGLICMTKSNYPYDDLELDTALQKELQRLEDEGLWQKVEFRTCDKYILDTANDQVLSGTLYLLKKQSKDLKM